ncbi:hypothetical protein [Segatella oris]|uniref:hypothetical protein n=1 Tax=Segatella oris TaxID=28135 RepID=UPI0028F13DAC|nr:hypothetical protein [Segatella oris]
MGKPKNAENSISNPSESQKTLKVAFPTPRKEKKRQKSSVARERKAEITKNHSSSTDESEKEAKNARHPWMKVRKR